jgi:hypothetical protein
MVRAGARLRVRDRGWQRWRGREGKVAGCGRGGAAAIVEKLKPPDNPALRSEAEAMAGTGIPASRG